METKRSLRERALRQDALLLFQHDLAVSAGRLVREGDEFRVVRVDYDADPPAHRSRRFGLYEG